jgi:hypothetical protein
MPSERNYELVVELAGGWGVNVVGQIPGDAKFVNDARDDCGKRLSVTQLNQWVPSSNALLSR